MADQNDPPEQEPLLFSDQPLHSVFEDQIRDMLDRADITEEQRQQILIALQCPCCGSGGLSISVKLKD
jgi:hypothetical protein